MQITPAILPHNFEEIQEKLSRIEGILSNVQIDLCDGIFGREKTWLPNESDILPEGFSYEFDVMVNDWRTIIPKCLSLGAKSIVAHVDMFTDSDMTELVNMVSPYSVLLGISVSNDKNIDFHEEKIRQAQSLYEHVFIQVMGIKQIGEQGQTFDDDCVERVKTLKQNFGDMTLQVDGGIVPDTAKKVQEAGANTVVIGSYIFGSSDIVGAIGVLSYLSE